MDNYLMLILATNISYIVILYGIADFDLWNIVKAIFYFNALAILATGGLKALSVIIGVN